ncbi:hypothetical protein NITGR_90037 [Nitrospina gracilis 3/211]|uniref:Uncharacterized protein n=1 Tax=Nitrospina gracilis (strain 3/211) TaxID=1266370 RepID=M1Z1L4_NITG3|nr:hypothetical protein NITGR_90037 [Nitrospina gracilis 3/211]
MLSLSSLTRMWLISAFMLPMRFFIRSWVMGRGVEIFSISRAMAFASKNPTQIGRARLPSRSLRMMMGIFVKGSSVSPSTFISTIENSLVNQLVRRKLFGAVV